MAVSGGAFAAGKDVATGEVYFAPPGVTNLDYLNIAPGGTIQLGTSNLIKVNDNGQNESWSGLVLGTSDTSAIGKIGEGTVPLNGLTTTGGEIHIDNGTLIQDGTVNNIWYLSIGSNIATLPDSATFEIKSGTLNIMGGPTNGLATPTPALQVGDFGGTGHVVQSGGTVNFYLASLNIGNQGGTGTYDMTGGAIDFQSGFIDIGRTRPGKPSSTGTFNVGGDALVDVHGAGSEFVIGNRETGATNAVTSKLVQTGGTIRIRDGANLYLSGNKGTSEYDLNGGTLEIGGNHLRANYAPSQSGGGSVLGTYTFNLGGGIIKVIQSDLTASVPATLTGGSTSTIDTNGFNATWNGVIDGSGNLRKAGEGTLTLTANDTYSGSTAITNGKVALSGAGNIANSSAVNLTGDGIFDIAAASGDRTIKDLSGTADTSVEIGAHILKFGTSNSTTFDGDFTGTGEVWKQGTGTVTFGGEYASSGRFAVANGTLLMTNDNAFTNATSPIFAIFGAPGATWDLGGAGHQKIGQFNIGGGGQTHVAMTLGNGHDFIESTQQLSLDGYLDIHTGDGNWTPTAAPTIIMTGVLPKAGFFTAVTDDLQFLDATVTYPSGKDVAVSFATNSTSFDDIANTPNQEAAGAAIYALGLGNPVFNAVATHNGDDALALIDDLSGDFHATTKSELIQAAHYIPDAVGDRLSGLGGSNGGGGADLSVADASANATPAMDAHGAGLWLQGYGHSVSLADSSGNAGDVDGSNYGVLGGIDGSNGNWIAGVGAGYSQGNFDSVSRSASGNVTGLSALAYAGGIVGMAKVHVGAAYTFNTIDTTREAIGQTLTASYNARTAQVFGEVGADMGWLEPFAGANYVNVATDAFEEDGGPAALSADAGSEGLTFTTLGVRAEAGTGMVALTGMVGWRHAFGDTTPFSDLTIQGQQFTIAGVPVAENAVVAEAGIKVQVSNNATLAASYAGQFAADAQDHGVKGTATLKF